MPYRIGDLVVFTSSDRLLPEIFEPDDGGLPPGGVPPSPPPGPDQFTIGSDIGRDQLRLYLQVALQQLGGPMTAEELRPRSIREIEELETRLDRALGEVRALRKRLS